jgi:hypothetical protein
MKNHTQNGLKQDGFDIKTGFYRKKKKSFGGLGIVVYQVIMSCPEIALQNMNNKKQ